MLPFQSSVILSPQLRSPTQAVNPSHPRPLQPLQNLKATKKIVTEKKAKTEKTAWTRLIPHQENVLFVQKLIDCLIVLHSRPKTLKPEYQVCNEPAFASTAYCLVIMLKTVGKDKGVISAVVNTTRSYTKTAMTALNKLNSSIQKKRKPRSLPLQLSPKDPSALVCQYSPSMYKHKTDHGSKPTPSLTRDPTCLSARKR